MLNLYPQKGRSAKILWGNCAPSCPINCAWVSGARVPESWKDPSRVLCSECNLGWGEPVDPFVSVSTNHDLMLKCPLFCHQESKSLDLHPKNAADAVVRHMSLVRGPQILYTSCPSLWTTLLFIASLFCKTLREMIDT